MWARVQCKIGKQRVAKTILTRSAGSFRGPGADFGTLEIRRGTTNLYFEHRSALGALKMWICSAPSDFKGCQNPLRVRWRTQQSVSGRFSPVAVSLSCTAPYLTSPFLYVISLGKCICRSPAIADARKGGVWGAPEIENGSPFSFQNCFCFFNFSKNHEKQEKCLFFNNFQGF